MHAFLQNIQEKVSAGGARVRAFCIHDTTKKVVNMLALVVVVAGVLWGGFESALIASGLREGLVLQALPQALPLLFSGALYIDRFVGVFGVLLAAVLLVTFLSGAHGVLWRGVLGAVLVFGVLTASTPLTLVAWLTAACVLAAREIPLKSRFVFLLGSGAMMMSVLLLSGGAFLADMTVVASISAQLPSASIFAALLLLFAGALVSTVFLDGVYLLIPMYVTLRLCLFFLAGAPALLLTIVALVAAACALYFARIATASARVRSAVFVLFMCVPLTVIAVEVQSITAVQCFLFGGLAIAASGLIGGVSTAWPNELRGFASLFTRFTQSALPGTFMGTGALLIFAGFFALAQGTALAERGYLFLLALLTLCTFLFLGRQLSAQSVRVAPWNISGVVQSVLLASAGVFFAQMLAFIGTTLGGDIPDWKIDLVFGAVTLTFTPWILLAGSALVIVVAMVAKKHWQEKWSVVAAVIARFFIALDRRLAFPATWHAAVHARARAGGGVVARAEQRVLSLTLKEQAIVLLGLFIVTFIVLF